MNLLSLVVGDVASKRYWELGLAALVDDDGWGLGVFKDDGGEFHSGIYGDARSDDTKHSSTTYVAPIHMENFDHNIVYEHRTALAVGRLEDICGRSHNHGFDSHPPHLKSRNGDRWLPSGGWPGKRSPAPQEAF